MPDKTTEALKLARANRRLLQEFLAKTAGGGGLGIGTPTPSYNLHVQITGANANIVAERISGAINYINATATYGNFGTVSASALRLVVATNWFVRFDTDFKQSWRLPGPATAGKVAWGYAAIDGTLRTIIPNATGTNRDVVTTCLITWLAEENSAGTTANGQTRVNNGGNANITVGTLTLQFAVAADGSLTVQRTAGSNTCDLVCDVLFF